jgi:hypothetical protein
MSSLPAATAQTDSKTADAALVATANANFIAAVDAQIVQAIALGKFQVSATTFVNVHPRVIAQYYSNLGYWVQFPDLVQGPNFQPADLFGEYWVDFWNNTLFPFFGSKPARMVIGWSPYDPYQNNVQNES